MKTLIVYDSLYGNTEKIAQAIGNAVDGQMLRAGQANPADLKGFDLLIVGSPTQQFRAMAGVKKFISDIPKGDLKGVQVTAFDTRLGMEDMPSRILPPFVKIFGYAAVPLANSLVSKGGKLAAPPEGFLVKGMEGPLKDGELERAANWARQLIQPGGDDLGNAR